MLLAYVVSLALALVPITPGGLGFVEAGLTSLLVLAGASAQEAVVATLLYRLASFWLPIPLGLVAWGGWRARRRTAGMDGPVTTTRPRLVATDLDGTIVRHDGEVSDRTVAALQAVEALGVPVVFVTGRPARWMAEVADADRPHRAGDLRERRGPLRPAHRAGRRAPPDPGRGRAGGRPPAAGRGAGQRVRGRDARRASRTSRRYVPRWDAGNAAGVAPLEDDLRRAGGQAAGPARGDGPGRVPGGGARGGR